MATADPGFQLGLLPERRINTRAVATAYGLVAFLLLIVINISLFMPEKLQLTEYHVTELIPRPSLRPEPAPLKAKPEIKAKLQPTLKLPVFEQPKLTVPREIRHEAPQPVEAPKVVVNQFATPQLKLAVETVRPQLVHTGDFGGSSQTPTVKAPVDQVQTGGFGDPNGLKGTGKQGAKLYAANMGSFDMPTGPGQGNGSGGAKGIKGTVASADFGSGVATTGKGVGGHVATGGFGAQQVVHEGPKIAQEIGPASTPVEITFKPNPVYTDEARSLKLEGEVLLEVSFSANGTLHVNRVVRGLGHGLDEAAIAAANKIRFKPALRMGQPVDSTAVVHVTFQMAY
ncbi:MAG TPA: energy transducer TonB [Candidatus Sulfotelmatobacter sp.]|jgi:TonB family protein|nr:energy transducer TonB [Candidatus Sulfotelmatobacter sp.]